MVCGMRFACTLACICVFVLYTVRCTVRNAHRLLLMLPLAVKAEGGGDGWGRQGGEEGSEDRGGGVCLVVRKALVSWDRMRLCACLAHARGGRGAERGVAGSHKGACVVVSEGVCVTIVCS